MTSGGGNKALDILASFQPKVKSERLQQLMADNWSAIAKAAGESAVATAQTAASTPQHNAIGNAPGSSAALPGLRGKGSGLFELFYDPQGGWKKGQSIGAIGGHSDHVHVAAGPQTTVAAGKLAQQMGLHVGENKNFGGSTPTSGHAPNSYHYKDEAIDVSGDPKKMAAYARRLRRIYGLS